MNYKEITLGDFKVIGLSVRTTNKDYKAQKDIAQLWENFINNNILSTVPNKVSDDIYCIYTDYENNFMGEYTTILGCIVSKEENIPDNLIVKDISACSYHLYTTEGKLPKCVGKTWQHIWQQPDTHRKYKADFDVYGKDAQNPDKAKVYTYLSVK